MKLFLFLVTIVFMGACSTHPIATVEPVEEETVAVVKATKACINTNTCK